MNGRENRGLCHLANSNQHSELRRRRRIEDRRKEDKRQYSQQNSEEENREDARGGGGGQETIDRRQSEEGEGEGKEIPGEVVTEPRSFQSQYSMNSTKPNR